MQYIKLDDQTIKVGSIILERHQQATARKVIEIAEGQCIIAEGIESLKKTRISWKMLRRYDVVAESR